MSAFTRLYSAIKEGASKYGFWTWPRNRDPREYLEHARVHLSLYLDGNRDEDHLGHALCDLVYAIELEDQYAPVPH